MPPLGCVYNETMLGHPALMGYWARPLAPRGIGARGGVIFHGVSLSVYHYRRITIASASG